MPSFITDKLLGLLLPLIVAPLTVLVGKAVLNGSERLDNLAPWQKQGVIVVIAGVLTSLGSVLGADICSGQTCAGDLSNLDINTLVSALLAFVLHEGTKPKRGRAR